MGRRKIGLLLITGSILVWLIDRISLVISTYIGELYCGKHFMQPMDGVVGDPSCGFNTDIYLVVFLFAVLLTGIWFLIIPKGRR